MPRLRPSHTSQAPIDAVKMSPTTGIRPMIASKPIGRLMPGTTMIRSSSPSIASSRRRTDVGAAAERKLAGERFKLLLGRGHEVSSP